MKSIQSGLLFLNSSKSMRQPSIPIFWKKNPNEELVAEDITVDIDKHFRAGLVLHWDDCFNHWMVDFDIIRVLKGYVGYSSWAEVPSYQRSRCYKNYNKKVTLPEWDIDQERYWHVVTRYSIMEYTINFDNKALRYIQVNFVGDTSSRSSSQYYEWNTLLFYLFKMCLVVHYSFRMKMSCLWDGSSCSVFIYVWSQNIKKKTYLSAI